MGAPDNAFVVKNIAFTLDGTTYANQVTKARLVPDTPIQQVRTCVPDGTVSDVDSASWTLEISGLQINKSGGLAAALRAAAGEQIDVVLSPQAGSGNPQATATIIAIHVPFGDEQGKFASLDTVVPVIGQPVFGTAS